MRLGAWLTDLCIHACKQDRTVQGHFIFQRLHLFSYWLAFPSTNQIKQFIHMYLKSAFCLKASLILWSWSVRFSFDCYCVFMLPLNVLQWFAVLDYFQMKWKITEIYRKLYKEYYEAMFLIKKCGLFKVYWTSIVKQWNYSN